MSRLRIPWMLATFLLLLAPFAVTAQSPPKPETLADAMAAGRVTAVFRGLGASSGDAIQVTVTKTPKGGPGRLVLSMPAGTQLRSATPGVQNMVVARVRGRMVNDSSFTPASDIIVSDTDAVTYVLEAYCSEFDKDNPSESTTFRLEHPDPALACILGDGRSLSTEALQAAVWIHTDRVTHSRLNTKFPVSQTDWARAQVLVAKCSGPR